jgi:spermidine synthase
VAGERSPNAEAPADGLHIAQHAGMLAARNVEVFSTVAVPERDSRRPISLAIVFGATLCLSAFLMFLIEPMIAKMVLPVFGGSPMVWNTCVAFFQIALLAGYAYAHRFLQWADRPQRAALHLIVALLPLCVLPFGIAAGWTPDPHGNAVLSILRLLVVAVGLPFVVLATTASTMQRWFASTDDRSAHDPYFLYAASNIGSLIALLAYPVLIEPMLSVRQQTRIWAILYAVFVALSAVTFFTTCRRRDSRASAALQPAGDRALQSTGVVSWPRAGRWVALSFVPSSLMLAVTTYLSTDIAAVPLLWILPLAIYLLTFVAAFSSRGDRTAALAGRFMPMLILVIALMMVVRGGAALAFIVPLHLLTFAVIAVVCHRELASDRPSVDYLTQFYFWISFGGMLGGVFTALVAPVVFRSVLEYPLGLVLACFLRPAQATEIASARSNWRGRFRFLIPAVTVGLLTMVLLAAVQRFDPALGVLLAAVGLPAMWSYRYSRRPVVFACCMAAMLLVGEAVAVDRGRVLDSARTFFGIYQVSTDVTGRYNVLFHGTTLHGMQSRDPARREHPLTYYHRTGPFGQAFAALPIATSTADVAAVGLGVGSLATYARPGQRWTFYEIDPEVERIARNRAYFTYLDDCGARCQVILGDGRLSLLQAPPQKFGLIILDAFSSDAIPVHLLTSEALSLYLTRLSAGGAIAFHVSNRHLSLGPMLNRLAAVHGLVAVEQVQSVSHSEEEAGKSPSDWVIMARSEADLGSLAADPQWHTPSVSSQTPFWTDDFSNILSVMHFR